MAEPEATNDLVEDTRPVLYDAHAHLVSDDLVRYPRNPMVIKPSTPREGAYVPFPPGSVGLPGGLHGLKPLNEKPTAEKMHRWMKEENVVGMAAVQKGMIYQFDNSYIVDAADLYPDEMRAVIIVDPQAPETPAMVRQFADRGIVGIRFFGVNVKDRNTWLSSPEASKVWELASELGLIVDIEAPAYGGHRLIPVVEQMADRLPNLRIVLDHVFLPVITDPNFGIGPSFDGFAARSSISVKFTSLSMDVIREHGADPSEVLRRTVDFFGADRTMWGSDIGTSSGTYKEMVARAIESTSLLNAEERQSVLHDTGQRIFGVS